MNTRSIMDTHITDDPIQVVLIDEEPGYAQELGHLLQRGGFAPRSAVEWESLADDLRREPVDFLVLCLRNPENLNLRGLRSLSASLPKTRIVGLLAPDLVSYDELLRQAGVHHILSLQMTPRQVADVLATQAVLMITERENYRLQQMLDGRSTYGGLIGGSLPMRALYRLLDQIARTDSPVLITGEEGSERPEVAKAIHMKSERAIQPLAMIDCRKAANDPDGTILFGHKGRGSHPQGPCPRTSAFAKAGKGVVVLDRIENLHIDAQRRLLDFMHRPFFQDETPGTPQPLARIMATSGPNLLARVEEGRFLRELFYRLNILQVRIPPLRERREDIPMLAQYYLRFAEGERNGRTGQTGLSFTSRALLHLFQYDWRGNLEELKQLVEQLAGECQGMEIDARDLPDALNPASEPAPSSETMPVFTDHSLKDAKRLFETEYFKQLLRRTGGNMTLASRLSRVGRPYLYKKIKEYDILPEEFR